MKKFLIGVVGSITCLGAFLAIYSLTLPSHEVLVNDLPSEDLPTITLHYSNATMDHLPTFDIKNTEISRERTPYTPYAEGFIEKKTWYRYLNLINHYRRTQNLPKFTYCHDIYEDDEWVVAAFSGDLSAIYVIDKGTWSVSPLIYDADEDFGPMYVSHIKRQGDTLLILGGAKGEYKSYLYQVSLSTKEVLKSSKAQTSQLAIYEENFCISPNGDSYFVSSGGLQVLSHTAASLDFIPLSFTPQWIYSSEQYVLALGLQGQHLQYSLLDSSGNIQREGHLPLPSDTAQLVTGKSSDHYFYSYWFDPSGIAYSHYVAIYDLHSDQLRYCIALTPYQKYTLLDVEWH